MHNVTELLPRLLSDSAGQSGGGGGGGGLSLLQTTPLFAERQVKVRVKVRVKVTPSIDLENFNLT